MKALSMYSGGCDGISLAASWFGAETVAYCDNDAACRALLKHRHPDSPIFENDEEVTLDALRSHGIDPRAIDIIFGGPPCQIASVAGQRLGASDPRNRWPHFLTVIGAVRPRWILAENVPGLLTVQGKNGIRGELFGDILSSLAQMGYVVGWCCYGAADVGAPHKRERLFIVGYAEHDGFITTQIGSGIDQRDDCGQTGPVSPGESARPGVQRQAVADTEVSRLQKWQCCAGGSPEHASRPQRLGTSVEHTDSQRRPEFDAAQQRVSPGLDTGESAAGRDQGANQPGVDGGASRLSDWLDDIATRLATHRWPAARGEEQFDWEPPRVTESVPDRATRIKMIGNSCPPQQYAVMLAAITELDRSIRNSRKGETA